MGDRAYTTAPVRDPGRPPAGLPPRSRRALARLASPVPAVWPATARTADL